MAKPSPKPKASAAKKTAKKAAAKKPPPKKSKASTSEQTSADLNPVDPRLLEVLICPVSGGRLQYDRTANELVSKKAKLAYKIREGVPIMLPAEARKIA